VRWLLKADAPFHVSPTLSWSRLVWLAKFARHCNAADFRDLLHTKTKLLVEARAVLGELIDDAGLECEFSASGTLTAYRDQAVFDKEESIIGELRAAGLEIETIGKVELNRREPALNDALVGGHYFSGDAQLRPDRYVSELADAVRSLGGEIRLQEAVLGFDTNGDRIDAVKTEKRCYRPREIVLALGAWSPNLAKPLGLRLPIQPGKGYSITYTRPMRVPTMPVLLKERGMYVSVWQDRFRLGGTMEFSGYDPTLNRRRLDALKRGAAEYLLEPEGPKILEEWYGWRPMTYDDLPILGRPHAWRNLLVATGHGMLGITMSALTGRLLAETITGREPSLDMTPYSPDRFD
jgi:D-amino-acid dehydrogenase